jgi:hypothetical protein
LVENVGFAAREGTTMSMKRTDLVRQLNAKVTGKMKGAAVPDRFGNAASEVPDKREQRRRDAEAGLVAFACKLPSPLVERLRERAASHEGGLNALVAELLTTSLDDKA